MAQLGKYVAIETSSAIDMGKLLEKILSKTRLGDKVESITTSTGIKAAVERAKGGKCSACERRKKILNGEKVG